MKVFNYLTSPNGVKDTYEIYNVVQGLKAYAISIYRNDWEDALDEAFFHIIANYDSSKGELEHYAISVVKTILLGKYKKEVVDNETTEIGLDTKSVEDSISPYDILLGIDDISSNVKDCISDMAQYFVYDYKFFMSGNPKDRKLKYTELFNNYSSNCIEISKNCLINDYGGKVGNFLEHSKKASIRSFKEDRYEKSSGDTVEFVDKINNIVLVRKKAGSHMKRAFGISIKDSVDTIIELFYGSDSDCVLDIAGTTMYATISGKIVSSMEELLENVENEFVGSILTRTNLKVFKYIRGDYLYFSSIKDEHNDVSLTVFGRDVFFSFDRLVVKEVI